MNLISNIYQPSIFRFRGDCSGNNLNPTPAPLQDEHSRAVLTVRNQPKTLRGIFHQMDHTW